MADDPAPASLQPSDVKTIFSGSVRQPPRAAMDPQKAARLVRLVTRSYAIGAVLCALATGVIIFFTRPRENALDNVLQVFLFILHFLFWLAPVIAIVILLCYMIMSIITGRKRHEKKAAGKRDRAMLTPISKDSEPVFWSFVEQICRAVRAPIPDQILASPLPEVMVEVQEISGQPSRGLELIVGMPFVSGYTSRQLAALITRELVRHAPSTFNSWCQQIAADAKWLGEMREYRSGLEQSLTDPTAPTEQGFMAAVRVVLGYAVSLQRGFVNLLLMAARSASYPVMHAWELEADLIAAQMCGVTEYSAILTRCAYMEAAVPVARHVLAGLLDDNRGTGDFPGFVATHSQNLPEDIRRETQELLNSQGRSRCDFSASLSERLRAVVQSKPQCIVTLQGPALELFHHYADIAEELTSRYYVTALNREHHTVIYMPLPEFLEMVERQPAVRLRPSGFYVAEPGSAEQFWLRFRAFVAGGLTVWMAVLIGIGTINLYQDLTRPSPAPYLYYIGSDYVGDGINRPIYGVQFLHKGDFIADKFDSLTGKTERATHTGWYYICRGMAFACDETTDSDIVVRVKSHRSSD